MIAPSIVTEIKRLLAEGVYSQREIARRAGVSRGSVGAIASGKRRDYDDQSCNGERELDAPTGPPRRCSGCGGMAHVPCRLCHVRKLMAESRIKRQPDRPKEALELELSGEQRARYERVRVRRMQQRRQRSGRT
ncbi:MAG: helix-turn-helix transcriptional regulator [Planctomycetota bacterium]